MSNCKENNCDGKTRAKGLCNMHYLRLKRHGDSKISFRDRTISERLQSHSFVAETGCREWTGSCAKGYGKVIYNGKWHLVHRLAWELVNGPIPYGMRACHKCDNRKCFDLSHIFIGTQRENIQDAIVKGRFSTTHRRKIRNENKPNDNQQVSQEGRFSAA